jgi:PAS domain S-box-containing protein
MLEFFKRLFRGRMGLLPAAGDSLRTALAEQHRAEMDQPRSAAHVEEKLRHSEEFFRLLVEGVLEYAIYMLDPGGRVVTWNSGARRIKGYTAEEIIGQHFSRFYPPEEAAAGRPQQELEIASAVGKYEEEGWRVRKDGSRFFASIVLTAMRDEHGNLRGFAKVTRDITERKHAEDIAHRLLVEEAARRAAEASAIEARRAQRQEREQREQLRVTLASIGDGVIVTDTVGVVTFLNPVAQLLTGWDLPDAAGESLERIFQIVNEQTRQPAENPVGKVLRDGIIVGLANHTILIARDGTVRPIDDSAAPIKDDQGRIIGVVLVFRDVTDRRRLEHRRSARLAITGVLSEASTVQNAAGGILQAVCESLEWQVGALWLVDRTSWELRCVETWHVPGIHLDAFLEASRRKTFLPGVGLPGRIWASGQPAWIPDLNRDTNFPRGPIALQEGLHGAFGFPILLGKEVLGVIEFFSHEVREPDEDLLEMVGTISGQIGLFIERKRAEEQLRQQNEELATAARQKDEFLAMLAHELRNPLGPIRTALHVMKMPGASSEAVAEARELTERQVRHLVRLVDDLLDVSRIMRGRIELRKEPVEVANIVASAVETARPVLDARGQELIVALPEGPVWLEADPTRLTQVLGNLLTNAAKFSRQPSEVRLTVEQRGMEVWLRVRDRGVGISPALLPRIFDLFVQGDQSLERSAGGLGIGLTVARRLVEMHGGTIEAHSEGTGKGSEFIVRLPALADSARREAARRAGGLPASTVPRRILVVDDNVDAAESIGTLLRLWGHEVRLAHTGPEALEAAGVYHPEVVVLDIGLPGINGHEVARRLRQQPGTERTVLVALTGYGQDEDRRRSMEAGFDHHLTKPVQPETLEELLAAIGSTPA